MIPLHLRCTTVVVSTAHAELLVSKGLAEWIPGRQGLVFGIRARCPSCALAQRAGMSRIRGRGIPAEPFADDS